MATEVRESLVPLMSDAEIPFCDDFEVCLSPSPEQLVTNISTMLRERLAGYVSDPPGMDELHDSMKRAIRGALKRSASEEELDALALVCSLPFMPQQERLNVNPRKLLEEVSLIYLRDFQEVGKLSWLSALVGYEVYRRLGYIEEWEWRWDPSGENGVTLVTLKQPLMFQRIEMPVDTSFISASPAT